MAVSDWSTTAASNTSVDGINIGEGCSPAGLNNAVRAVMASVRVMYDGLPNTTLLVTKAAAVFSGTQPIYTGRGAMLHHNNSANTSARIFVQAEGAAVPTMANGDILATY